MSVQRIASRYAKSLIDIAQERDSLEPVFDNVLALKEMTKNRDFYMLLKSPVVNPSRKKQAIEAVLQNQFNELTVAFIRILISKSRETHLPSILNEFIAQYKAIKNISTVRLTTAVPASDELLAGIRKKLAVQGKTEELIEFETQVDPKIIGGFVLEFDGNLIDASVADKLEEMKKEFTKVNLYRSQVERT